MKIFLDTAHIESISKALKTGLIDGITTNPSHLAKEAGQDIKGLILEICKLLDNGDVSVEITEKEPQAVYKQAKAIAQLAPNIVVKIPCYKEYLPVIKQLVQEGVQVNITLLFTLTQGLAMAKLGVKCISPFIGRLDEIDADGLGLIADLREAIDIYGYKTQILAASIRDIRHIHDVILIGADIATIPMPLFDGLIDHPLTLKGMDIFENDWKKLGIKQFP